MKVRLYTLLYIYIIMLPSSMCNLGGVLLLMRSEANLLLYFLLWNLCYGDYPKVWVGEQGEEGRINSYHELWCVSSSW